MPEIFLQARSGAGYRPLFDRVAPGTFEQAVADAGTSFELEVPAVSGDRVPHLPRFLSPVENVGFSLKGPGL